MSEYVPVLGTLAGVIIGGLINYLASRSAKQREWHLSLAKDQIALRQRLYSEFLAEAQRLTTEAIFRELAVPEDVRALDSMMVQMTLLSPEIILERARALRRHILVARSSEEVLGSPGFKNLREEFVAEARKDLSSFERI